MSKKQLAEPFTVFKLSWLIDFFIVWWISKHKYSIFNVLICRVISLMPSANWGLILGPGNDCPYSIIHSPPPPSSLWAASLSRSNDMAPQILPICGYSSSIGLATAVLLEKRFKVYATMRNLAKKGQLEEEGKKQLGDTLTIKQMDVCSDESRWLLNKWRQWRKNWCVV